MTEGFNVHNRLENSNIFELMVIRDNIMVHKQIEVRDGLTFFRIKKRKVRP